MNYSLPSSLLYEYCLSQLHLFTFESVMFIILTMTIALQEVYKLRFDALWIFSSMAQYHGCLLKAYLMYREHTCKFYKSV